MSRLSCLIVLAILVACPIVYAANKVVLTVYYPNYSLTFAPGVDTLYETDFDGNPHHHCFRINLENDTALGGLSLGFRIFSDDGVTWNYLPQPDGWGEGGQGDGFAAATVVAGSRLDPPESVFDMTRLLIDEKNIDGLSPDSILFGGVSLFGQLDPGPMQPMIDVHMEFGGLSLYGQQFGTLCFDSCFIPPAGIFVFSNTGGQTFPPIIESPVCYVVAAMGEYDPMSADDDQSPMPYAFALNQNHPNPFNPATTITYSLARKTHVTIAVYNVLGQNVTTLIDEIRDAGQHQIVWDGNDHFGNAVASGVYIYKMLTNDYIETRKMILMR